MINAIELLVQIDIFNWPAIDQVVAKVIFQLPLPLNEVK